MDDSLVNLIEYKAGYARRLFLKKNILTLLWQFANSESAHVLLLFQVFAIDRLNAEFCT